ncbi:MAG TPA: 4-alpha-glucanotransferase, partial [Pseudomonas sp.]|nr:4-alpha-glucanotransferase [Pseudomonas sp.]
MSEHSLHRLAEAAGLSIDWIDADGHHQRVAPEILRAVLAGLGLPAEGDEQIEASLRTLDEQARQIIPALLTGDQHRPLELGAWFTAGTPYRLELEDGQTLTGTLDEHARLPGIAEPGYHRLLAG